MTAHSAHMRCGISAVAIIGCLGLYGYFTGGQEDKDLIASAAIFFVSLIIIGLVSFACTPRGGA